MLPGKKLYVTGSVMQELQQIIREEQPHINTVLMAHVHELPPLARPVAEHVLSAGGKRLRPLLTLLCGRMLGCGHKDLYLLGSAVEMLHAATLLHDDILDNASLRRGRPAAHTVFGATKVILAGDALLAKALSMVSSLGDTRLTSCIAEAVMQTAEGEIAEFAHLRDLALPQEGYRAIITGKTAWMLRAACELGALRAGVADEQIAAVALFGLELGIAFQKVDDALDFSPEAQTGKPMGGDIKEGKVTPPLLFYLASLPPEEAEAFRAAFMAGTLDENEVARVSRAIVDGGHAQATRDLAEGHLTRAAASLNECPAGDEQRILGQMIQYIRQRTR